MIIDYLTATLWIGLLRLQFILNSSFFFYIFSLWQYKSETQVLNFWTKKTRFEQSARVYQLLLSTATKTAVTLTLTLM